MAGDRKRRVAALEAALPPAPYTAPPLVIVHAYRGETDAEAILHEFGPGGLPEPPPGCSPGAPRFIVIARSVNPRRPTEAR